MAYKCVDCGHIFEEGEQGCWSENRGEFWGVSCGENMSGCPKCHGEYEKTVSCVVCGSEHLEDELNGGVCDECVDEYRKDFDACYDLCLCETTEIKINSLLASLLDIADIEQILKEYLKQNWGEIDCSKFIDEDKSWFGERLAEEVKKNENSKK